MASIVYPVSPSNVPHKLTGLSTAYKVKASLAILGILIFFVLYFALVIALCYLVYLAVIFDAGRAGLYSILLKLGAIAGAVMLVLFTIKFLFKLKNPERPNRIQLKPEDHPQLWEFVERICVDTGAPRPKSIYIDPDVNAYVSYTNLWLSLVLPVRKELTIGLGLVNCLNLSQFKAVLAHEFGHFSQRSMKIGSYIASANTIIHDMIFTRDTWDDLLEKWMSADLRLSIAAWAITPVIWIIRQILRLFYSFLNIMHSSLSREMEFNADKVAVSVAGSEAIVSALWKLNGGAELWNHTINHAYLAAQKDLHSRNLYTQQSLAQSRTESERQAMLEALPADEHGGQQYFSTSENSKAGMYASHPPNDLREVNAKTPFIPCPVDDRSPWILFSNTEELQRTMTSVIYQNYLQKTQENYIGTEEFERFSVAEREGQNRAAAYENTFQDRFLHIPDRQQIEGSIINTMEVPDALQFLNDEIKKLMKPVREIDASIAQVHEIAEGRSKEKTLTFNNVEYRKKELQAALNAMVQRKNELLESGFVEWDTAFCGLHLKLANQHNRENELVRLYAQHDAIMSIYKLLLHTRNSLANLIAQLQDMEEVTEQDVTRFGELVHEAIETLNKEIALLESIDFVPLPNIDSVQELQQAIIDNGVFNLEQGPIFEEDRFGRIMHTLERATLHCQRLDAKSIAHILQFHSQLQKEYARGN